MREAMNVENCVEYLRSIGVDVSDGQAETWAVAQREMRARRRAHNREIKRSCGHFATYWSRIVHSGGTTEVRVCRECGRQVEYRGASLGA